MDLLNKADIKGKMVKIIDEDKAKFIGIVDFVDYTRGKVGIVGSLEGYSKEVKSLQVFSKSDIIKIKVLEENKKCVMKSISDSNMIQHSSDMILHGSHMISIKNKEKTTSSRCEKTNIKTSKTSTSKISEKTTSSSHFILGSAGETASDSDQTARDICQTPAHNVNKQTNSTLSESSTPSPKVRKTPLESTEDSNGFPCFLLPQVTTVPDLPGGDMLLRPAVRRLLWPDSSTPPQFSTPRRLYLVEELGDLFEEVVERLRTTSKVGLSCEGKLVGRNGRLSLLVLSTVEEVFVFDIKQLGRRAFKYGLYTVLSDPGLVKVVHDSRQVCDLLFHQEGLQLVNVFDTLAAHLVFSNWAVGAERKQRSAKTMSSTVRDYLGVPDEHLFTFKSGAGRRREDGDTWLERPLAKSLLLASARNCLFLLPLAEVLEVALDLPVMRAGEALMESVVGAAHEEAEQIMLSPQCIPSNVVAALPCWKTIKSS